MCFSEKGKNVFMHALGIIQRPCSVIVGAVSTVGKVFPKKIIVSLFLFPAELSLHSQRSQRVFPVSFCSPFLVGFVPLHTFWSCSDCLPSDESHLVFFTLPLCFPCLFVSTLHVPALALSSL